MPQNHNKMPVRVKWKHILKGRRHKDKKKTTYGVYSVLYLLIFWENLDINILSNKKEPPLGQIVVFVPIALQIQKMPPLQSCAMHKCATKIQLEIRFHCRRLTTFSVFGVRKTRPVSGIKTLFYKAKSS